MIYRLIAPQWLLDESPQKSKVLEGEFTDEQIKTYNQEGYNIYFLPNAPSNYISGRPVDGRDIDNFDFVFIDFDLKSDTLYGSKQSFINALRGSIPQMIPSFVVDSGNGVHAYYQVSDLDAMSYLRFQRRLCRLFTTDEAVSKIYQLMRVPNTLNNKSKEEPKLCTLIFQSEQSYTSEQLDKLLPAISAQDESYCQNHYAKTYRTNTEKLQVDDSIPLKFAQLLKNNSEVKDIWSGGLSDRSAGDFRLGHIMYASGLSREEAMSVLVNSPKALNRTPDHRIGYAQGIVDKIWTHEITQDITTLSSSVRDILSRPTSTTKGTRLPCYRWIDDTAHGFRLGHVMGLVAGSGVGKTVIALNLFLGFVESNPDYDHFFVSLEQPAEEIAQRWKSLCTGNTSLYDRVHILDNYNADDSYRHLSLSQIKEYIIKFQKESGRKIGCCVIDHIGILKKQNKNGENEGIIDICQQMKSFANETGTFLIMQSQSSREKAGIGDLEIGKDAAYGTVFFESFCDYVVCIWQPLKRMYSNEQCPTITAFKFGKIRHKNQSIDKLKEDVCYKMYFDTSSGRLREVTQEEEKSFTFFLSQATNKRKQDRKTDLVEYVSIRSNNV